MRQAGGEGGHARTYVATGRQLGKGRKNGAGRRRKVAGEKYVAVVEQVEKWRSLERGRKMQVSRWEKDRQNGTGGRDVVVY